MRNRTMMAAATLLILGGCASHDSMSGTSTAPISEKQARHMLEQDGYSGVANLHQDGEGGWMGSATANGQPVTVMVTPAGAVMAR